MSGADLSALRAGALSGSAHALLGSCSSPLIPEVGPVRWELEGVRREDAAFGRHLVAGLRDKTTGLRADLNYEVHSAVGAIRWSGTLTAAADGAPVRVVALGLRLAFDLAAWGEATVHHLPVAFTHGGFPPTAFAPARTTLTADGVGLTLGTDRPRTPALARLTDAAGRGGIFLGFEGLLDRRLELRRREGTLEVTCGAPGCDVRLRPGESLPLPGAILGWHTGDTDAGAEALRRFLRSLRADRRPAGISWISAGACKGLPSTERVMPQVAKAAACGFTHFLIDHGWSADPGGDGSAAWDDESLRADPARFPNGLEPIASAVRAAGMGFGLALDLERVRANTRTLSERPELLVPPGIDEDHFVGTVAIDFSRPEVVPHMLQRVGALIERLGLSRLRLDSGLDPQPICSETDAAGRSGSTALRYEQGLYALYEGLRQAHPELLIEFGRSGGRRLDPRLWRIADAFRIADEVEDPAVLRRLVFGAGEFFPAECLTVGSVGEPKLEALGAAFGAAPAIGWDLRACSAEAIARAAGLFKFHRRLRSAAAGTSHALCSTPAVPGDWDGRQYHDGSARAGMLVIHHPASGSSTALRLRGLDPASTYHIHEPAAGSDFYRTGRMLMDDGLDPTVGDPRARRLSGVRVLVYKAVKRSG